MAKASPLELLAPSNAEGNHRRFQARIEKKLIEIGRTKLGDSFTESTLVDCELHILGGASSVHLLRSTLERCTLRPRRELKNLRFDATNIRGCTFFGRYTGCRFGSGLEEQVTDVRDCDFSHATRFHLCDFLDGADVGSMRWPPWPHFVVTDLPSSRDAWLRLELPEEMKVTQHAIVHPWSISRAITIFLPALTERSEELRELLAKESYIVIAD